MIRCIRGMKMDNDQLYDLLDGIQRGKVKFQVSRESDDEGSGSFVFKMCIRDRSRWSFHSENDSPLPTSLLSRCRAGCRGKSLISGNRLGNRCV